MAGGTHWSVVIFLRLNTDDTNNNRTKHLVLSVCLQQPGSLLQRFFSVSLIFLMLSNTEEFLSEVHSDKNPSFTQPCCFFLFSPFSSTSFLICRLGSDPHHSYLNKISRPQRLVQDACVFHLLGRIPTCCTVSEGVTQVWPRQTSV